jgi:hypothetical protein
MNIFEIKCKSIFCDLLHITIEYLYLRYIVKNGINFGMDYCLYRDTPDRIHSEMCCRVINEMKTVSYQSIPTDELVLPYRTTTQSYMPVSLLSSSTSSSSMENVLSWRSLSTLTRVMPVCVV